MSNQLLPLASFAVALIPGEPIVLPDEDFPVSIRLTMAAINPQPIDDEDNPSTLHILKHTDSFDDDMINKSSDEESDEEEEEEEEEKEEEKPKSKKEKKAAAKKAAEEAEQEEDEDMEDDEDVPGVEEHVICTLSPKTGYQQPLDMVITAGEEVIFQASGSYVIHLTGNYVEHPYDDSEDEEFDGELNEEDLDDLDSDEYDLSPDEDEILDKDRVREILDQEEGEEGEEEEEKKPVKVKSSDENKKRTAEAEKPAKSKKQKKEEKAAKDDKKVAFSEKLEQGPSGKKFSSKKLEGGVTVEDRTVGEGPTAKAGHKVGVRYIGKLANGKVFDSNTKGKPFYFTLGKGEVIKGWDIGVTGMAVKGERRIIIPPPMAYGKQSVPGIPANSELTFDVKLVNIK